MNAAKNINYAELVEFIGEKFERTDQTIRDLGGGLKELKGEFNELRGEFHELRGEVKEMKGMFNRLQTSVDRKTYHEKTTSQEITMINSQIKRHDRWIHQIVDKSKTDLSPH